MTKVLCIYHSADLDGKCSAAIVRLKFPDAVLHGMNYGDETPWNLIELTDTVIICDFSLPMVDMAEINECKELYWYDHHKSAIADYGEHFSFTSIAGIRDVNKAGCELTWKGLMKKSMPDVVELLGSYDCWRWVKEPKGYQEACLNLQYGMRLDDWNPESGDWALMFSGDQQIIKITQGHGYACLKYQSQMMEHINTTGVITVWEGWTWYTVNCHQSASTNYEDHIAKLQEAVHIDGVIVFWKDKGFWRYSLRSFSALDVSTIAKKYGGGGHAGAAGFSAPCLLEVLG